LEKYLYNATPTELEFVCVTVFLVTVIIAFCVCYYFKLKYDCINDCSKDRVTRRDLDELTQEVLYLSSKVDRLNKHNKKGK